MSERRQGWLVLIFDLDLLDQDQDVGCGNYSSFGNNGPKTKNSKTQDRGLNIRVRLTAREYCQKFQVRLSVLSSTCMESCDGNFVRAKYNIELTKSTKCSGGYLKQLQYLQEVPHCPTRGKVKISVKHSIIKCSIHLLAPQKLAKPRSPNLTHLGDEFHDNLHDYHEVEYVTAEKNSTE